MHVGCINFSVVLTGPATSGEPSLLCHQTPPPKNEGDECFHGCLCLCISKVSSFHDHFDSSYFFLPLLALLAFLCSKAVFLCTIIICFSWILGSASVPTHLQNNLADLYICDHAEV